MRSTPLVLWIFALTAVDPQTAIAIAQETCIFTVEPRLVTYVELANQVGSLMSFEVKEREQPNREWIDYEYQESPIGFNRSPESVQPQSFRLTAECLGKLRARISNTTLSASLKNTVESSAGVVRPETIRWVKLWDANIFPLTDIFKVTGLSAIDYWAYDRFSQFSTDLTWREEVSKNIFLNLGLRGNVADYAVTIGEKQYGDIIITNTVTLETESNAEFKMIGPVVGLEIEHKIGPLNLNGSLSQAFLYNNASYSARFTDIDSIAAGKERIILDGTSKFGSDRLKITSETEMEARVSVDVWRLSLGAGGYLTIWPNFPLVPKLHGPWDIGNSAKAPTGLEWRVDEERVSFTGLFVSAGFKF